MSTTTIRIEDDLKARIAAAAERAGKTSHAYIVDAIARTVEQAELDDEFHRVADARWARLLSTGKSVPWDAAKAYLEARERGERPRRPVPRALKAARPAQAQPDSPGPAVRHTKAAKPGSRGLPIKTVR